MVAAARQHKSWDSDLQGRLRARGGPARGCRRRLRAPPCRMPGDEAAVSPPTSSRAGGCRSERDMGPSLFEELLLLPQPYDTAELLNTTTILVEDLLLLGIRRTIHTRMLGDWLDGHPSVVAMRALGEGLLALAEGDHEAAASALQQVLAAPDPCLAKPIVGTLRTALAEALLANGDRGDALLAIQARSRTISPAGPASARTAPRRSPAGCRGLGAPTARSPRRRGGGARRRRAHQRAARRPLVHLAQDGRSPRVQHPRQARPVDPRRDRGVGRAPRPLGVARLTVRASFSPGWSRSRLRPRPSAPRGGWSGRRRACRAGSRRTPAGSRRGCS